MREKSDRNEEEKFLYSKEQTAEPADEERLRELLPIAKIIQERLKEVCNR